MSHSARPDTSLCHTDGHDGVRFKHLKIGYLWVCLRCGDQVGTSDRSVLLPEDELAGLVEFGRKMREKKIARAEDKP